MSKSENLERQSFNSSVNEDNVNDEEEEEEEEDEEDENEDGDGEVFEVEKFLAICYGDPKEKGERGLYLKVRWKNYGPEEDTWEPLDGLGDCLECLKDFVTSGFKAKILPLPGDVDVICGGPPCQGISGFNRFRNKDNPLQDEKNKQLQVFMEMVEYLKPKFVLMENVVDIVKFAEGYLGRYALSKLIHLNYQVRMGMMAAGAYGLPQFRMRAFFWGARPNQKLPRQLLFSVSNLSNMASFNCFVLALFMALSFSSVNVGLAARHLLQLPTLPPLPSIPNLPQPTMPTLPQPSLPNPVALPPLPTIPTLPPLPSLPSIPTLPTTIPSFSPPPARTTP